MYWAELWEEFDYSETTLHIAASRNEVNQMYAYLTYLSENVDLRRRDGKTALMISVAQNCPATVSALLSYGANIDTYDVYGDSPLRLALGRKTTHPQIIKQFLEIVKSQEATRESLVERLYESGCTLYHAVFLGDTKVMKELLECGLGIDSTGGSTAETPLILAVKRRKFKLVRWLLDKGANVNGLDEDGVGPLYIAAENRHLRILRLLLERGADPNVKAFACGLTPLLATFGDRRDSKCGEKYDRCAELLLRYGATPSQKLGDHPLLLDDALLCGNFRRINALIGYVAMREMQGESIAADIIRCDLEENQGALRRFQQQYERSKKLLAMTVSPRTSLLQLLTDGEHSMRIRTRDQRLIAKVKTFCSEHALREMYPLYFNLLTERVTAATHIVELEDKAILIICDLFNYNLNQLYVFARQLVKYLNVSELQLLCGVQMSNSKRR